MSVIGPVQSHYHEGSPAINAVDLAVFEIFSVKQWRDLEN